MYGFHDRVSMISAPVTCCYVCLNLGFSGHRMTQYSRTGSEPVLAILDFHS